MKDFLKALLLVAGVGKDIISEIQKIKREQGNEKFKKALYQKHDRADIRRLLIKRLRQSINK